ncbi:MAG: hypothetical protein JSU94_18160 [Phycisphaerales bacterium]|nr:MAG: hypothetical protein JSU94_18160 [Phycisphaerales bacterium]
MKTATVRRQTSSRAATMLGLFVLMPLLASGCASGGKYMTSAKLITRPQQGKAVVTFIRPSIVGSAVSFGLWDSDKFVGIMTQGCCIQYETLPGEHYFMARGENWSCIKADLAPNRQYVIKTNPVMGVWKARVALDPVTKADYQSQLPQVRKWLSAAKPMMPDPQTADAYRQPRIKEVLDAREMFKSGRGTYMTLGREDYLPE